MMYRQNREVFSFLLLLITVAAVSLASIALYLPVLRWMLQKISLTHGYLHGVGLLALLSLALYRIYRLGKTSVHLPKLIHPCLLVWVTTTGLYLFNEANMGLNILSAAMFVVYLFGISGHFIAMEHWRAMLLPVLLTVLILPFEHYLDVYLGFPLRLISAEWVGALLRMADLPALSSESILLIENRAAVVGLDCSGIKSLWIGAIFYLLLTWIERYRVNMWWLATGLTFLCLLLSANMFRIAILVVLDLVLQMPQLADFLHQSLGLLGFVVSCAIAWMMLYLFRQSSPPAAPKNKQDTTSSATSGVLSAMLLLVMILACVVLHQPLQIHPPATVQRTLCLPSQYHPDQMSLSVQEKEFFENNNGRIQKMHFAIPQADTSLTGSMILVWSKNWKTHHVPENCYLGQGYTIARKGIWVLGTTFAVRSLSLERTKSMVEGGKVKTQTGVYWFQAAHTSTPNYSARVLDGVLKSTREWVMVSILCDRQVSNKEISDYVDEVKILLAKELRSQA